MSWLKQLWADLVVDKKWPAWMLKKKSEMEEDEVSWWVHWVITMGSTIVLAAIFGRTVGLAVAIAFLAYFGFREGSNYQMHKYEDPHGMKRWTKDGILDFAGPLVNCAAWFYGVVIHG